MPRDYTAGRAACALVEVTRFKFLFHLEIRMQTTTNKPLTPDRLMQMTWAYSAPLIIEAAIRNRLFDLLDSGPKTLEELSRESGASNRGLRMIANALVAF